MEACTDEQIFHSQYIIQTVLAYLDCFSYQLIRCNVIAAATLRITLIFGIRVLLWPSSHKVYKVADTKFPVMVKPANLGLEVAPKYIHFHLKQITYLIDK